MEKSDEQVFDVDPHFFSIVLSLSSAAMQQLGKVPNPMSQKIEKNLLQARMTIDILIMLKNKTKSNLTPKETQMLKNTLSDLQLNYADEAAKEEKSKADGEGQKAVQEDHKKE